MHATKLAGASYQRSMRSTSSPRAIESEALVRVSVELRRAYETREGNYPAYIAALSKNLALWTQFSVDASSHGNQLPNDLRAGIIRIAAFVRTETARLQRSRSETGIAALLEINANVSAGLRQTQRQGGEK
jgi:flagellar protein FlaF